jgi:hypothetical protein
MVVVGAENSRNCGADVVVDFDGVFYDRRAGIASRFSQGLRRRRSGELKVTCVAC